MILTVNTQDEFKKVEMWLFGQEFPEEVELYIYVKENELLYAYKTVLFRGKWMLATNETVKVNN